MCSACPNITTYHAYDLAGRQTRLTWGDGFYVDYDYTVTGEVTAIRENGASSGAGLLATYGYDQLGRRTSVTRGNGTVTSYGYDNVSRLASLTQDLAGSGDDLALGFGYNKASQIASATRSNDGYAWTGSANAAKGYTVNGLNQLTAAAGASVSHDARGNVTAIGGSSYGYSSENLLASAPGGVTLGYDPLMRLYTTSGSGMRFRYDGLDLIGEVDGSGVLQKRYVHGDGVDEPIVEYIRNGSGSYDRKWLHADERGSIVAQSNDAGARTSVNSYDEYGVPASGNVGRFQYTGQAWLPDVGLYYYKSRMLAAQLGRFMHTDPIGYGSGMNWYGYVSGDPVNFVDPTGLCSAPYYDEPDCEIVSKGKKLVAPANLAALLGHGSEALGSNGEELGSGIGAGGEAIDPDEELRNKLKQARTDAENICAPKRSSAVCRQAIRKYQSLMTRWSKLHPLPPIPKFKDKRPSAGDIILGGFGCIVGVATGGGSLLGWMATAVGCAQFSDKVGRTIIPTQERVD